MKKRKRIIALIGIMTLTITFLSFDGRNNAVYAKSSEELRKEQEAEKKKLSELEEQKKNLQDELGGLETDLTKVSDEVASLKTQISDLEKEIEITNSELEEAKAKSDKQYEQMKQRIQFMYENSLTGEATYLLGSESIADFLNKTEYISSLTQYDRSLLDSFEATQKEIEEAKAKLEADKESLLASQKELEDKETALLASIDKQNSAIDTASGNISNQENKLEELDKELQKMIALENSLKASLGLDKPDVSGLVKSSLIQRENSMPTWGRIVTPREGEENLLAAIIYCEAGGEPYEGQLAVATVVLNRVNSQYFPNTITDVIYSPGQFTPVWSGRLGVVMSRGLTTDSCRRAAREVLDGNFTGTWLYFCTVRPSVKGDLIGNQVFY